MQVPTNRPLGLPTSEFRPPRGGEVRVGRRHRGELRVGRCHRKKNKKERKKGDELRVGRRHRDRKKDQRWQAPSSEFRGGELRVGCRHLGTRKSDVATL